MVFHLAWALITTLIGAGVAAAIWSEYRSDLRRWLMENNLQESALGEAYVFLEKVSSVVHSVLYARPASSNRLQRVTERALTEEERESLSEEIREALRKNGRIKVDLLTT